jgi:gliding motility-associated-like protein/uncharacterized repeat protein (TIGR01451 family)
MKCVTKILTMCVLLISTSKGFAQAPALSSSVTFTITAGSTIVLHGGTNNAVAYQWYLNGVRITGATGKDYTTGVAGTYSVVGFNKEGCPSQQSDGAVIIVVPAKPKADTTVDLAVGIQSTNTKAETGQTYTYLVTANNNSPITGTQVQVTYTIPAQLVYSPQPGSNTSNVIYDPATHTLTWTVGELPTNSPRVLVVPVQVLQPGSIESIVDIKGKQPDPILANNVAQVIQQVNPLIIPNVFTPNGDGKNDTFVIPGLDTYAENEIVIINRWGNDVYEKKNYKNDWTGNGLVEGTYFYVLKVLTTAGVWDAYKGYLTLIRTKAE